MITKREVSNSIARCEPLVGFGPLDTSPVSVARGDLAVLVEAAKNARFTEATGYEAKSESDLVLPSSR